MPAFLVEDGTGLETATSYATIAQANDFLGSDWAESDTDKERALMGATQYADSRWGYLLQGTPLNSTQSLEMPRRLLYNRYGVIIEDVPLKWINAICLYAKEFSNGSLYPTPPAGTKEIKKKKVTVGPITTESEYVGSVASNSWLDFPLADNLCADFKSRKSGSSNGGVIR